MSDKHKFGFLETEPKPEPQSPTGGGRLCMHTTYRFFSHFRTELGMLPSMSRFRTSQMMYRVLQLPQLVRAQCHRFPYGLFT